MKIRCIAVDDEPLALNQLTGYISKTPFLKLVASCQDAFEAMKVLSEQEIDLIFLDIDMPDLSGIDFARSLAVRPLIIFTTAYSEYAIEGFRLDATDYLLKPFEFHDLLKAADKAYKQMEFRQNGMNDADPSKSNNGNSLFVKANNKVIRIDISEIKYIEGMSEYVRIYIEGNSEAVICLMSLKTLEERLPSNRFMRIHRSYIVNLQKIKEISRLRVIFNDNVYIPVDDKYKEYFLDYVSKLSVGK